MVEFVSDLMEKNPELKLVDAPKGSVARRCPDTSLAQKLTGYEPKLIGKMELREQLIGIMIFIKLVQVYSSKLTMMQ